MFKTPPIGRTTLLPPIWPCATAFWRLSTGSAWDRLDVARQLDLLRVYEVVLNRFGRPDDATVSRLVARFDRTIRRGFAN